MELELDDAVAVVLGANRDVGRALSLQLAAEGARVAMVGRHGESLDAVTDEVRQAGGRAVSIVADLVVEGEVERVFEEVGRHLDPPDVVANTIGPFPRNVQTDIPSFGTDEEWTRVFRAVFLTAARVGHVVLPQMIARRSGALVNVGATSARTWSPRTAQYGAMKAAMVHTTRSWAQEAAPHDVRVNAVLPGFVRTASMARRVEDAAREQARDPRVVEQERVAAHPEFWGTRMARVEEVAEVITFLLSHRASYVNGAVIPVDGGSAVG